MKPMTRTQAHLLRSMPVGEWVRPMDVGGFSGSYHSAMLTRFCRRGLVERRPRYTLMNVLDRGHHVASWEYRLTDQGLAARGGEESKCHPE